MGEGSAGGQGLGAAAHAARCSRLVALLKELVEIRDGHVLNEDCAIVGQDAVSAVAFYQGVEKGR